MIEELARAGIDGGVKHSLNLGTNFSAAEYVICT